MRSTVYREKTDNRVLDVKLIESLLEKKNNSPLLMNSIGMVFIKGFGMVIQFLLLPFYIDYFGDNGVAGVWITIVSVMSWIMLFDFGIGQGLRNELTTSIAKKNINDSRQVITTAFFCSIPIVILISVIGVILVGVLDLNKIFNILPTKLAAEELKMGLTIMVCGTSFYLFSNLIVYMLYSFQRAIIGNGMSFISNVFLLVSVILVYKLDVFYNFRFLTICYIFTITLNIPCLIGMIVLFNTILKEYAPRSSFFCFDKIKNLFSIGGNIFLLQIVWMVISKTNEFLVAYLSSAESVIEYQVYNKIFGLVGSFVIASFIPMWSAVTKAMAEQRYLWIKKRFFNMFVITIIAAMCELIIILPNLQRIMDIWLGNKTFIVNYQKALSVLLGNVVFILHSANTNVSNGMSNFRLQTIVMPIASILDIPLSYFLTDTIGNWSGVIWANILVLSVYEILQFFDTEAKISRFLRG